MIADPVDRAWAVDPLPTLPPTPLRGDWPAGGLDPFDVSDRRTQRMMFASGFTRAFPATDGAMPASDDRHLADVIRPGYTTMSLLEKLAVVQGGRLVAEWPRSPAPTGTGAGQRALPAPMHLCVQFQRSTHVWAARDPRWLEAVRGGASPEVNRFPTNALAVSGRGDYASTLDLALALSGVAGDEPLMVMDVLEAWDWH